MLICQNMSNRKVKFSQTGYIKDLIVTFKAYTTYRSLALMVDIPRPAVS